MRDLEGREGDLMADYLGWQVWLNEGHQHIGKHDGAEA
jgi:hypothetical protein